MNTEQFRQHLIQRIDAAQRAGFNYFADALVELYLRNFPNLP
jgi:hypothetical protein